MIDYHLKKRNKFLENIIEGLEPENIAEVLRIFLESSREFRKNNRYPHDMTGPDYHKMLNKEFAYQKEKVMNYIRGLK